MSNKNIKIAQIITKTVALTAGGIVTGNPVLFGIAALSAIAELMNLADLNVGIEKDIKKIMNRAEKDIAKALLLNKTDRKVLNEMTTRLINEFKAGNIKNLTDEIFDAAINANNEFSAGKTPMEIKKLLLTHKASLYKGIAEKETLSNLFIFNRFDEIEKSLTKKIDELEQLLLNPTQTSTDSPPIFLTDKPARLTTYIPRKTDEEKVLSLLNENDSVVVVNGIGGIGKSELCKQVVLDLADTISKQSEENRLIQHIGWVRYNASMKASIINAFEQFVEINDAPDDAYKKIMKELKKYGDKLLLFIDNVTDRKDFDNNYNWLKNFKLLVTSRLSGLMNCITHEIEQMDMESCIKLFYKFFTRKHDDENLEKILELVNRHTLVVELLAKSTMNSRKSIVEMYELLVSNKFNLNISKKIDVLKDDEITRNTTFETEMSKLFNILQVSESQKQILSNMSLMPYLPVETTEFCEWIELKDEKDLEYLITNGWIQENEAKDKIIMHPTIRETIRLTHKPTIESSMTLIDSLANKLYTEAGENPIPKFKYLDYVSDVANFFEDDISEELATLCNNIALRYKDKGDYNEALKYAKKSVKITEEIYKDNPNHPFLATSYNNIALIYQDRGDYPEALSYAKKAMKIREAIYKDTPNHPDLATSYNNIALIYQDKGDYPEVLKYAKKDMNIMEEIYKDTPNHPDLATSYNNIALIYQDKGDYPEALKYAKKDMNIMEEIYKDTPNHPDLATSYNNIALISQAKRDYDEALNYAKKAMNIREEIYRDNLNHPSLATSYHNMATLFYVMKNYPKALEYAEIGKEKFEKAYDFNHPFLADVYGWLTAIYLALGNEEKAKEYYDKMLAVEEANKP